jgi:MoCo/4Fe-4S cofactor protein with predicted Tat translocation signal
MTQNDSKTSKLDLVAIREKLRLSSGRDYWRSLDQLADTQEFRDYLHNEFPSLAAGIADAIPRREVLRLLGASLALAGLTACSRAPENKIVPYVRTPEDFVPGRPLYYATAMPLSGYGTGLLVESHLGRPTRVDGNPLHPASLGASSAIAQASVLGLYDPDRSQTVVQNGRLTSWVSFLAMINAEREAQQARKGAGMRVLTGAVTSPTLASQLQALFAEFPHAKWVVHEPAVGDGASGGARQAFGTEVSTLYSLDKADVIVCLDSDLLTSGPAHLRYAREWAARRSPSAGGASMNRLYAVESSPSNTGAAADHRLCVRPAEIEAVARSLAAGIGVSQGGGPGREAERWVRAAVRDLKEHRGRSLVVAGEAQPAAVHALAHAMNDALGNVGSTVRYIEPVGATPAVSYPLADLAEEMRSGAVDFLVIADCNPAHTAPADVPFVRGLSKVRTKIQLGLYQDETGRLCNWHLPEAHYLESWGDVRAFDGTVSVIQPLIAPLYEGKTAGELVSILAGKPGVTAHQLVRDYWKGKAPAGDFEAFWQTTLHDGVMRDSGSPAKSVTLSADWNKASRASSAGTALEIVFRPDPSLYDGRFANNGWLQEVPKPMTKLTWANAALISPATAERLGLQSRDVVEISLQGRTLEVPVWITPGHARECLTLNLGHGRRYAGKVGSNSGFNAYALRTVAALWEAGGAEVRKTGRQAALACTQDHHGLEGRNIYRSGTLAEFHEDPHFVRELGEEPRRDLTLYPEHPYNGHAWGMSINLSACIGCNACVVACQAENNSPVVGPEQVSAGREMHWIRIDRYFQGHLDDPKIHFQPVMCQHCENAPCELVCPVNATNHSSEGLNQMVYNRCVGTRYCSNNCPYKVRRFNFLQYSDYETPGLVALRNPDVTVRGRGVMEKCTYCVQRINAAKITAEKEGREVKDGEIVTACQSACPTRAITFGDVNDKSSRVAENKQSPLNYGMLAELNVRPRTSYLAKLTNPNPEMAKE